MENAGSKQPTLCVDAQSSLSLESIQPCRLFTFPEIQLATHDFDESLVIGHGGFGKVYKGTITNGKSLLTTAIKRLESSSNQGAVEFWAEVDMLSKLRHCHLVSLIGYCNEGQEMILVYEFMPNGTLADHLHKFLTALTWVRRLKICIGAARGLDYLHTGTGINHGVMHRDVKTSNILLDNSWAAKISDFGLSKIGPTNQPSTYVNTMVRGTFGYIDPNYFYTGKLTRKSDVYAFGVVLFEVLCGKKAVDTSIDEEQCSLAAWAHDSVKEGRLKQIVDLNLRGSISSKCLKEFAQLADTCLHSSPKQRPTMAQVVAGLESILASQEKTKQTSSPLGMKIFGKMLPTFLFLSSRENPGVALDLSSLGEAFTYQQILGALDLSSLGEAFTYQQILVATGHFNDENLIKKGHSGDLFRGIIDGGIPVIIKRTDVSSGTKDSYMVELDLLSKVTHPRLVPLLGHCLGNENEKFLIYKYMPNGDSSSLLYRKSDSDDDSLQSLDWITRLKIAIGAAEGLSYLHHECTPPLVHRDVQASSILLDDKYEVRFGSLSEVCTQEGDSHSNQFTRLPQTSEQGASGVATATCAYDVYCFGKVLLELVTGKMGITASNDPSTKDLLDEIVKYISIYDKELVTNIVDPTLIIDEDLLEEVWAMAIVARSCLNPKPARRPLMSYILKALENPLMVVREESDSSARLDSNRKQSKDVFPEPLDVQDEERSNDEY